MKLVAMMDVKDWRRPLNGDEPWDRVQPMKLEQLVGDEPVQFYCPLYDAESGERSIVLFYVRQVEDDYELVDSRRVDV